MEAFNEAARIGGATFNGEIQAMWNAAPDSQTALDLFNAIHDSLVSANQAGVV
jgi:hypothetical protein